MALIVVCSTKLYMKRPYIGPTFFVQALTYDPLHMVLLEMHRVSLKFVVHMLKNATYGKNGRLNVLVDFPIGLDFSK